MQNEYRLEITTKIGCSINCVYCPQKLLIQKYNLSAIRPMEMSFMTFKTCIDKLPLGTRVDFSGMSEPWLNKYCTDMLLYAIEKKYKVVIYTTLVGMTVEDYYRFRKIECERFVIHVPDQQNNSKINVDEKYLELLKLILEDKERNFEISAFSCHGIVHPSVSELLLSKTLIKISNEFYIHNEMMDRAGNIQLEFKKHSNLNSVIQCSRSGRNLNQNVLLPNGDVVLCCMDYSLKHKLGNLVEQDYDEIRNGKELKKIIKGMENKDSDILCRNCSCSEDVLIQKSSNKFINKVNALKKQLLGNLK